MSTRNRFKTGRYSGPARPCRICGERTTSLRFDVCVQLGDGNVIDSDQHIHQHHPLPYFRPEQVTPHGTLSSVRVWLKGERS